MAAAIASNLPPYVPHVELSATQGPGARETLQTWLALLISLLTSTIALLALSRVVFDRLTTSHLVLGIADAFFAANIMFLMYGSMFYLFTRLEYFKRLAVHRRATREDLESIYDREHPHSLAILVPSYREELRVVRMALMSAALTEYPDRRVVLLIDDPPNPRDPQSAQALADTRRLARTLDATFRSLEIRYAAELAGFMRRCESHRVELRTESRRIASLYRQVASWMEAQAATHDARDHYDAIYVNRILLEPARMHRQRAAELEAQSRHASLVPSKTRVAREYRRLAALFAAPISSFERKRFVNLSHACNKAMNLNSYLSLLGRNFREFLEPAGLHLQECDEQQAQLRVRNAEYVITLDADSMLLNDYALRLTHVMDRPEAARFGVVQSPFTAVPGSLSLLERIAGAQTDVQWFGTQGSTRSNGSFWVGANALLRRAALEDICETVHERGFAIKRYIHDRTLVEDTESTIDLVVRGWKVFCYPERLSYSATPPDFGSLVIQRRRWANGPVLIVPKLMRYARRGVNRLSRLPEILLRLYTLTSVVGAASMLLMIAVPFPDAKRLPVLWLILSALPYYVLYCRDLMNCGYEWWDLPRVYGMNLLLIPVNLSGLFKSIRQALTGRQSPFVRTPKVPGRTAAPAVQILMPTLVLASVMVSTLRIMTHGVWAYGAFGVLNGVCLTYAIGSYIGIRAGLEDVATGIAMRIATAQTATAKHIDAIAVPILVRRLLTAAPRKRVSAEASS